MDGTAREYLLIALAIDEIEHGIVDSYYGPPEIRDEAKRTNPGAAALAGRAAALRARLSDEIDDEQRRLWLDRQLLGLETIARRLAGEDLPYLVEVERCFDAAPEPTPPEVYAQARAELDELLPGDGDLLARLDAHNNALTIPVDKLGPIVEWLTAELRTSAQEKFALPAGENLTLSLVTNEPWGAYNWYDGDLHSRIEVNTDLPVRASRLIHLLAHEAFPGHHLEHATKEQRLVREQGRFEASVQLINTPESYISEGLAEVGVRFVAARERWLELFTELCARAGLTVSTADAQRTWQITEAFGRLDGSDGDAALQLHSAGRSREQVVAFLEQDAVHSRERAEKMLDFISHPLWRTYVFCYAGGARLLNRWIESAGDESAKTARFSRLLGEQITPSGIAVESA